MGIVHHYVYINRGSVGMVVHPVEAVLGNYILIVKTISQERNDGHFSNLMIYRFYHIKRKKPFAFGGG